MIKISYRLDRDRFEYIKIQGHANSASLGNDLICAGVSAIVNGTINFLKENYAEHCQISVSPARVTINCSSDNKDFQLCLQMFFYQLKNVGVTFSQYFQFKSE